MEIRSNKAHPRSLPSMPPKDFIPTHSAEETASINDMIEEKISFIKEERAERRYYVDAKDFTYSRVPYMLFFRNLLTRGDWLPQENVAVVDKKVGGGWDIFGHNKNGKTYLHPEEALFLIEVVIFFCETPNKLILITDLFIHSLN